MPEISDAELNRLRTRAAKADEMEGTDHEAATFVRWVIIGVCTFLVVLFAIIFAWRWIMPSINLHKAEIENQRVISQQHAESDAAVYAAKSTVTQSIAKAQAEVERAKGAAKAQGIIAGTLTEPYLRYLYINNLGTASHEVIYLPTEAGLPILEAGRFHNEAPATTEAPTPAP